MKKILAALSLIVLLACKGSDGPKPANPTPVPPVSKSYGKFRPLSPKVAQAGVKQGFAASAAVVLSTNINPRSNHRAIQMLDGRILLVGGDIYPTPGVPTMDIYDPKTESFTKSSAQPHASLYNSLNSGVSYKAFAMVNLPDGRVWIGGGGANDSDGYKYDIYDPAADSMTTSDVLTLDGENDYPTVGPCDEAYYIGNNQILTFLSVGSQGILDLTTQRQTWMVNDKLQGLGTMTNTSTIQDAVGNIYVIGGNLAPNYPLKGSQATIFKFDVTTNTWTRMHDLSVAREGANLAILPGNKIGIYGGIRVPATPLTSVEIYDITTNTITSSVPLVGQRSQSAVSYLQTGYTLISGGFSNLTGIEDSELVHKADIDFSGSTGLMTMPRNGHTATSLPNGLVLIAGGSTPGASVSAEIFDPLAKLYVSYISEQIVMGQTMQFTAKDATGATIAITWTSNKPEVASIDSNGLLTTLIEGNIEVTATSVADSTVTATVRISVLPQ